MASILRQRQRQQRQRHKPKGPLILHPYSLLGLVFLSALSLVTVIGKTLVTLERRYITKLSELLRGDTVLVECNVTTPFDPNPSSNSTVAAASSSSSNGILEITVRKDLSPIAASVFVDLVNAQYYDGVYIFRALPHFIAQWGYRNDHAWHWSRETITKPPKTKDHVTADTLSNTRGTLSFAAGSPWVLQVFVNLQDNIRLDKENSRPFATLSEASMQVLDTLYMGYRDNEGQIQALKDGTFPQQFPKASRIDHCQVVSSFTSSNTGTVSVAAALLPL